ncbi:MAG: biotin--[Oscillospiraceae bacterium]|nr:biotin--[acetyl-CoA-carboxylase] ligase [Oscillospiraceae bacterium]MBR7009299.1 biotin--[acetyl-CoA-carboxylase] ligase [Oscillospiraceae bacterium]
MDKQKLIELLRAGSYVSGAELGKRLGVTRAAVSKAIAALKREGWAIESVPNRGHRLAAEPDRLDRAAILAALGEHPWAGTLELLDTVDSTNNYLKTLGAAGAPHGTAAVADCQTGGRGRLGRRFDSAPGSGIYLSVLLRPACPPQELLTLTAQAAVAVRRAVRTITGTEAGIKWVNDLVLGSRKICGILTELSIEAESGLVSYAVVGVGINCNRPAESFPPELRETAGSILSQTGKRVDRNALAAEMIRALSALPDLDWREEYRAACVNLGKEVQILAPGKEPQTGVALDVGPEAELIVRTEAGVETVQSGEVSVRGLYGYVP